MTIYFKPIFSLNCICIYFVIFSRLINSCERILKLSLLSNDIFLINLLSNNNNSSSFLYSKLYLFKKGEFLRVKKMKMILNNKNMEDEYFNYVKKNSFEPSKEIKEFIKTFNIFSTENFDPEEENIFTNNNILETIKFIKDKSVYGFQKIKNLKYFKNNEKLDKNYLKFIKTIKNIYNNWIYNPNKENINYLKNDLYYLFIKKVLKGFV